MSDEHEIRESVEQELIRSSSDLLAELRRISDLEAAKQQAELGSEAQQSLAVKVEEGVLDLLLRSRYQTRLVELEAPAPDTTEEPRHPAAILDEWRAAQRRLHELRRDLERAADDTERLRMEHRRSAAFYRD